MTRDAPVNVAASVRARLLNLSKARDEDFTLTLMNFAAERFLFRLSRSRCRDQFVLKGAMLFAVRIGERYRPTRDLDLLGTGEATEAAIAEAVREIVTTPTEYDGVTFDIGSLQVFPIREDNRYGGIRAVLDAHLAAARIHVQVASVSAMRSHRPPSIWISRRSPLICPRPECSRIQPRPSSRRRLKRWSTSVSRTAA